MNLEFVVTCLDNLPGSQAPSDVINLAFVHVYSFAASLSYYKLIKEDCPIHIRPSGFIIYVQFYFDLIYVEL